jgi:hypothetical protein
MFCRLQEVGRDRHSQRAPGPRKALSESREWRTRATERLTGADLLAKGKDMAKASKSEQAQACGYVSTKKDGSERLNLVAFYEALLEAKGLNLGGGDAGGGKPGRKLSYVNKVQFNGNLLVGKAYTAQLGLEPGDEFEIKLGRKAIRRMPVGANDEEE